ncbi:MAG: UDP-N-acetylmuramoyl-tripeptide--D-alanyl-D-alanine ligase [Methylococcales bacterium]|nr:UDP-N-acetylmuramoyl-tripeptide--D-alanyl-D-alanine ligase [Methylococcales bacterium]MCK5926180.1 UDP-N-acetylmuramoyl-tripeptide--D-alanyl-D-alanine ligase [Methylococcales bacterium]
MLTLGAIAVALKAKLTGQNIEIDSVSIDSRTLNAGALYIAIKGDQFDGHDFIQAAEKKGAGALLVNQAVKSDLPQLVVANTRLALAQLGGLWRQKSQATVFAVTGSNGKTTIKEMLAAILSVEASVLATAGNFNNEIGVPLTLLRLSMQHRYAVVEMGANHSGEIAFSSRYALADIVLINNVGDAHLEGFGSLKGIAEAKGEIITGSKSSSIAILNQDDAFYRLWLEKLNQRRHFCFSLNNSTADVYASDIKVSVEGNQFQTAFNLHYQSKKIPMQLKLAGKHNVNNAVAAAAAALANNIPLTQIQQGLAKISPVKGRLQPWLSRDKNLIIDDSYNANPSSLKVALEVLKSCAGEPWLVLGAFGEMGAQSVEIHRQLGVLIRESGVKRLFAVGDEARGTVEAFGQGGVFFESQSLLIEVLQAQLQADVVLLIKGSRTQKMENVAAVLIDNFRN